MRVLIIIAILLSIYTNAFHKLSLTKHSYFNKIITKSNNNVGGNIPPINNILSLYMTKEENESTSTNSILNNDDNSNDNPIVRSIKNLPNETKDDIKSTIISFAIALIVRLFIIEPRLVLRYHYNTSILTY